MLELCGLVRAFVYAFHAKSGLTAKRTSDEEWTSDKERTHPRSAFGFGFCFGLVNLENPKINPEMIGLACVRSLHRNSDWPSLRM